MTSDTFMHMYYLPDDDLGIFAYLVHSQVVVESASTQDLKDPSGREAHHGYLKKGHKSNSNVHRILWNRYFSVIT